MILQNSKGRKKEFVILMKVEKDTSKYIIYQDIDTSLIYAGKEVNNNLEKLKEDEYKFLNRIMSELE